MTTETLELALFEVTKDTAVAVFTDEQRYSEFYAKMKAETDKFIPNLATKAGRDEIASNAFKVTKAKTTLDKHGLALTEEWRLKTKAVNAARAKMTGELDELAKAVRKPLTDWEEAEEARVRACRDLIIWLKSSATVSFDDTAATVRARGMEVYAKAIDPDAFRDLEEEAQAAKAQTVEVLKAALARLTQEEADKAELEALRAANAERERIAAEQAEADRLASEKAEAERIAEERRVADEKAEQDRIERARQEAAERAQREAQEQAEAERIERERKHNEELAAEKARADKAEADRAAEAQRIADEQADRDRKAKEEADAQAKREADQVHRTKIKSEAKAAIMTCGADEETARKIVMAIIAGEVPHVRVEF